MSWRVVYAKECRDNLRDRRTLFSSLSLAVLGPLLFVGLMTFVLNQTVGEQSESVPLTVIGGEHAPDLMAYLATSNVTVEPAAPHPHPSKLVADGIHELLLVVPDDYARRFSQGGPLTLALIRDSSKFGAANRRYIRVQQTLQGYAALMGALRLQVRGVDPRVMRPFDVKTLDTASPAARALTVLASMPYLLVLVVFMGGFYLAIDATAGEREHGSLEPLLIQPVSRTALVLAKTGATATYAMLALALFLLVFAVSVPMLPLHKVGMTLTITTARALAILAIALPLALLAAALLTLIASFAKSYKEAQTYLTMVIVVPTLPLIVTQLLNVEPSAALMLVPSISQATLIADLIVGKTVEPAHVALSMVSTLAVAAALAWLSVRLYRREHILI